MNPKYKIYPENNGWYTVVKYSYYKKYLWSVSQVSGTQLGNFPSLEEAEQAIKNNATPPLCYDEKGERVP